MFKPYYLIGQLDKSKEILIPTKKWVDGKQVDGYSIINPIYTYENGRLLYGDYSNKKKGITSTDRAAVILNRGWIPKELKNPLSRPEDVEQSKQLVKLKGVMRPGKDLHDYKYPNNPADNEWHNLALEDIAIYWDLPNKNECKFYYFQATDVDRKHYDDPEVQKYPVPFTRDEAFEDQQAWKISQPFEYKLWVSLSSISAVSAAMALIA